jgi:hypothetical protein
MMMTVLLPEAVIRLTERIEGCSREEAENLMLHPNDFNWVQELLDYIEAHRHR